MQQRIHQPDCAIAVGIPTWGTPLQRYRAIDLSSQALLRSWT